MDNVEKANKFFTDGFSCSQSVFAAFSEEFGLEKTTALKISQSFAGGMGQGLLCGAATGAYLVIGLKYGRFIAEDIKSKEVTMDKIKEFNKKFLDINGKFNCSELLNADVTTDEGKKIIEETGIKKVVCPKAIKSAVKILDEIL